MSIKEFSNAGRGAAVAAIGVLATASFAAAGPTYTSANGGTFTWYGQVNPTLQYYDDGAEDFTRLVDNENSNTRLGFIVTQPLGENTLKFTFETALGLRGTDDVDQNGQGDIWDWQRTSLRKVDIAYETPRYGTFSIGQGAMAADGVTGNDLSGTSVAANVTVTDAADGYLLRDTSGALTSLTLGDVFATFDGSRRGRVRYDSPTFGGGFSVATSYGEEILAEDADTTQYDIALNYANDAAGDFELQGGLAVNWTDRDAGDRRDTIASFAGLHQPTGLSAAVAAGDRDTGGRYYYLKLGYQRDFFAAGRTYLSIDFYDGSDLASDGDSAESIGFAAVQKIDRLNLEAYLLYRDYSYSDTSATSYQDGSVVLAGARWKF